MGLMREHYLHHLQALLPWGAAWPRVAGATLNRFLDAVAEELARIDGRALQLSVEANPRTTLELLADWERVAGLPDNCSGTLRDTVQGRRQVLVSKLISLGGQSRSYFEGIAAEMGYSVVIEEYSPFRAGRSCAGSPVSNGPWRFAWSIRAPETTVRSFTAGSFAGERLASWGNADLECRIRQLAPAHTIPFFRYLTPIRYSGLALEDESGYVLLEDGSGFLLLE